MVTHPPEPADIDGPHFAAIARAVRSVYRDAVVVPALLYGATDSRHYAALTDNVYRFHGMRLPLEDVSGFHGTNERVQIVNYANAIEILARMVLEMTGAGDDS